MGGNLILVVSAIYVYVACEQCWKGNQWLGLAFLSYAVANIAMYQTAK